MMDAGLSVTVVGLFMTDAGLSVPDRSFFGMKKGWI
jgi:hypothetical protein